ncbi:NADPH-dependent FMN reductase [Luteipulveratus halotolerans]|uniref:NADPH-dependent FMN reductase-like domain-containing protein n=1 Tax=Luteipulveratus halotolerans TaxID=1631356 RepID=A0A0L6CLR7_9MICO|nr:NAD(P)H-dependent oxidoreductase [Luteipulveratus halotolerans]KNX38741.1 hypothetical protein VV01_18905 [Luteipulveratus halotolerans]
MTQTTPTRSDSIRPAQGRPRLAVIIASVRQGRFAPVVAAWTQARVAEHSGFEVDVIDLADEYLPLELAPDSPVVLGEDYPRPPQMARLTARLDAADAFLVITPEYNHSFPASIKAAIDWHFTQWQAKPVAFVSYGGHAGGARAVNHLRQVFTELHAVSIRDGVAFPMVYRVFDEDGQPTDPEVGRAAKVMLDELAWWARALRTAREETPYAW